MKTIHFASSNRGKIEEVTKHLKSFGIAVHGNRIEMPEISSDDLESIAKEKAKAASNIIGKPVIVEDTGLYFGACRDFPGTHPKFVFKGIGYEGIFRLLEGKSRKACFRTVVAYCEPGKEPKTFEGISRGEITEGVSGKPDPALPYDAVFMPESDNRTYSQMTKEEKAKTSHRAKALEAFARWFNSV
ncbi:MAG: RdgB/HAM1 family non-canonical purine NTP pyrophosphatase [Candidatus Aenigmarchaeota archaeon]|nr:RdgB/HAM1 family non-canonical purine NTP pyrophosphatase [Candidatus Aenigmarchaeota archaeon]